MINGTRISCKLWLTIKKGTFRSPQRIKFEHSQLANVMKIVYEDFVTIDHWWSKKYPLKDMDLTVTVNIFYGQNCKTHKPIVHTFYGLMLICKQIKKEL